MQALNFPGGEFRLEEDRVETRLREFLGPGRSCKLSYVGREWSCWLYVGAEHYQASSRVGMLDAIANALMAAYQTEEST